MPSPATLPLSPGQRGLWFLHRLHPEGSAYHLALASRIVGKIPATAIRDLFQAQVDRHEALRTTFPLEGYEPVQRVADRAELSFEEIDAIGWDEAAFRARLEEEAWKPFDLDSGPLFRVQVFQRAGDRVLLVVAHHIVVDFGSFAAMLSSPEGGGVRQYRDFLAWQAEIWTRGSCGRSGGIVWPICRCRSCRWTGHGGEACRSGGDCRWREIGPGILRDLKKLARSKGGTLYVALLAGFQALLSRYTGQTDFAVGSPAAGRPKGFARTMGYFTNPLAVRADLSGDPSFLELLGRTRQRVSEALDHQHLPLPVIVERLRAEGREGDLFRTLFVFHRDPSGLEGMVGFALGEGGGRLRWDDLELEPLPLPPRAAQFDVTLAAGERRGALGLQLVYDADLFDGPTAVRWLEHLSVLLEGATAHPDDADRGAAVADPLGAPAGTGGGERSRRRGAALEPPGRRVRAAGREDAGSVRRDRWGEAGHLSGAAGPRDHAGRASETAWESAPSRSWGSGCHGPRRWWRLCSGSCRPEPPTCRSIPRIRRSGSTFSWRTRRQAISFRAPTTSPLSRWRGGDGRGGQGVRSHI